jgi:c-di-GMP-binding flagellar brake protein YcgR
MSAPGEERRTAERKGLRVKATVILGQAQAFEVRTLDLSATGMGIVAQANPKPGMILVVRFLIPLRPSGYSPFEAKARVVHSVFSSAESGFKVGLSFTELSPASAAAALRFLG